MGLNNLPDELLRAVIVFLANDSDKPCQLSPVTAVNKHLRSFALPELYSTVGIVGDINEWPGLDALIVSVSSRAVGQFVQRLHFTAGAQWYGSSRITSGENVGKVCKLLQACENVVHLNLIITGSWNEIAPFINRLRLATFCLNQRSSGILLPGEVPSVESLGDVLDHQTSTLEHLRLAGVLQLPQNGVLRRLENLRTIDFDCEAGQEIYDHHTSTPVLSFFVPYEGTHALHTLTLTSIPTVPFLLLALFSFGPFIRRLRLEGPSEMDPMDFPSYETISDMLARCKQLEVFEANCTWFGDSHLEALKKTKLRYLSLLQPLAMDPDFLADKLRHTDWLPELKLIDVRWQESPVVSKRKLRESRLIAERACRLRGVRIQHEFEFFRAWRCDNPTYTDGSDSDEPAVRESFGFIDRDGSAWSTWCTRTPGRSPPASPTFDPSSPGIAPDSPKFQSTSPSFLPTPTASPDRGGPAYLPPSPRSISSEGYAPLSPSFCPNSPVHPPPLSPQDHRLEIEQAQQPPSSSKFAGLAIDCDIPDSPLPARGSGSSDDTSARTYNGYV